MLLEEPCDVLTEDTASSNAKGTVKKYTQVQLVLPSKEIPTVVLAQHTYTVLLSWFARIHTFRVIVIVEA